MLTETRAEAVDHSAAELRRIERDLHDGAQARLVALAMTLGMADELFDTTTPSRPARLVERGPRRPPARRSATCASVVRGIHPPVLADRGLAGAVAGAGARHGDPGRRSTPALAGRPPAPVESAVYFAVAECLANVGKHAGRRARLDRRWPTTTGVLRAVVGDDGRGGADPAPGTGMRGVMRRLAAFDGTMSGVEPGRRARPSSPWRSRAPCPRRRPRPPPGRPDPAARGARLRRRRAPSTTRPTLAGALRDPAADAAVLDVRLPPTFTDEGLRAAIAVRAARPGFPVLVLSQYVEQLYARELLASGEGGDRLPAQGPGLRRRASSSTACAGWRPAAPCSTPRWSPTLMARQRDEPLDRLTAARARGARR